MFKCIVAWFFVLLNAAAIAGVALFWPAFAKWVAPHSGWSLEVLLSVGPNSHYTNVMAILCIFAVPAIMGAGAMQAAYLFQRHDAEAIRLREQDARADRLSIELESVKASYEQCQVNFTLKCKELEGVRNENVQLATKIAGLKGVIDKLEKPTGYGGWGALLQGMGAMNHGAGDTMAQLTGIFGKPKEPTLMDQLTSVMRTMAQFKSSHDRLNDVKVEPPKQHNYEFAGGNPVPYRIKAEPLLISSLREGDEVVFIGASTELGIGTVENVEHENVCITHRRGGKEYSITERQILGVLRRIGS
jgi:hypothetical protein